MFDHMTFHDTPTSFLRAAPKTGPKILVGDIETFPALSYHFNFWNNNVNDDFIREDTSLMSTAFKWLEQDDAFYVSQRGKGKNIRDDKQQLLKVRRILHEADFIVAHNGKKFDMRKLRGYMALRGLPPFEPVKVIDTYQLNKQAFGFDKQSLKWTSSRLSNTPKLDHAAFPGSKLWVGCLEDDPAAWLENFEYNFTDVISLEQKYLRLRGWYERHPNLGPYFNNPKEAHCCPNCGSFDVKVSKRNRMTDLGIYHQYVCNHCGKYSRGRYLAATKEQRAHILVS